jgi:hypothetical protein
LRAKIHLDEQETCQKTTEKDAHLRNYHHVNHPRFLLYTIAFASCASDTNVKSGNSMVVGLGALEEAGCPAGGRAKELACVALTRMGTTYLKVPSFDKRQVCL